MGRKRRIRSQVLTFLAAACLAGCTPDESHQEAEVMIRFSCGSLRSRAGQPDEDKISDISLMIFDEKGEAEECFWLDGGLEECRTRLMTGKKYILCACANLGRQVEAGHIEELNEIRCHLAYPDDYRDGIPMFAHQEFTIADSDCELSVELERLMARISLQIDRRMLSRNVEMHVRSVRIGNCPRKANVFRTSRAENGDDCFPAGFILNREESDNLNRHSDSGLSKTVTLYMLENMQGTLDIDKDSDKTFDANDYRSGVCSYIEIVFDYTSDNYCSGAYGLKYRFYLGEGPDDLNVERNCHYHITVIPEDSGISENSWRVDKTDIQYCGPTSMTAFPSNYIRGDIGEKIHIWCEVTPENAPFDVGMKYMQEDKANGIYDYVIDEDGRGATLTLTGPGRGLIYMEAGDPINDAALFIIEVNLP